MERRRGRGGGEIVKLKGNGVSEAGDEDVTGGVKS